MDRGARWATVRGVGLKSVGPGYSPWGRATVRGAGLQSVGLGYSPWGHRVGHNLVTKQQKQLAKVMFFNHLGNGLNSRLENKPRKCVHGLGVVPTASPEISPGGDPSL